MPQQIVHLDTGAVVAARIRQCDTPATRVRGLLGTRHLDDDEACWIAPCNAIHTFFMMMSIDVAFLDEDLRVLKLIPDMTPFRLCLPVRCATSVLEGPVGMIQRAGLKKGSRLAWVEVAGTDVTSLCTASP